VALLAVDRARCLCDDRGCICPAVALTMARREAGGRPEHPVSPSGMRRPDVRRFGDAGKKERPPVPVRSDGASPRGFSCWWLSLYQFGSTLLIRGFDRQPCSDADGTDRGARSGAACPGLGRGQQPRDRVMRVELRITAFRRRPGRKLHPQCDSRLRVRDQRTPPRRRAHRVNRRTARPEFTRRAVIAATRQARPARLPVPAPAGSAAPPPRARAA
jgi:hypothetical protein